MHHLATHSLRGGFRPIGIRYFVNGKPIQFADCPYLNFTVTIMPMLQITAEQATEGLNGMADALDSLLIANDIPKEVRAVLGHVGMRRLPNLANYESTEDKFREALQRDVGLEATDAKGRILLSNLIEAWTSARNRLRAKDDEDAIARAQGRPAPLDDPQFVSMRRGWERLHGEREDVNFPSKFYVNKRLRQLEGGELRVEHLSDVTSVAEGGDEDDDRDLDLVISGNSFRATRKSVSVPLPKEYDTEQFRHRMRLMMIHWDVAAAQFSDKRLFTDFDRSVWADYVEHVMGERVLQYRAYSMRLGWADFLNYEYEIRKFAIKKVNRGTATLVAALREAWLEYDVKQLHFTLPLTTMGKREGAPKVEDKKRSPHEQKMEQELKRLRNEVQQLRGGGSSSSNQPFMALPPPPQPLALTDGARPGNRKGKSKGGGKGKSNPDIASLRQLRQSEKLYSSLPNNGGTICYYFNIRSCDKGRSCTFVHVCMRCLKEGHSALDTEKCKQIPASK